MSDDAQPHLHAVRRRDRGLSVAELMAIKPPPETEQIDTSVLGLLATLRHTVKEYDLPVQDYTERWESSRWEVAERLLRQFADFEVSCPTCGAGVFRPCLKTQGPHVGDRAPGVHVARQRRRRKSSPGWLRYEVEVKA